MLMQNVHQAINFKMCVCTYESAYFYCILFSCLFLEISDGLALFYSDSVNSMCHPDSCSNGNAFMVLRSYRHWHKEGGTQQVQGETRHEQFLCLKIRALWVDPVCWRIWNCNICQALVHVPKQKSSNSLTTLTGIRASESRWTRLEQTILLNGIQS